jgi:plasmid stabilization system protein ParE
MTLPVTFHPAARAGFIEAAAWSKPQRPDLGVAFIVEIERCIALVAKQSQLYAVLHRDVRRVTAEHSPYSVYFRSEARGIVVLAVFHGCRDPAIWQRRA